MPVERLAHVAYDGSAIETMAHGTPTLSPSAKGLFDWALSALAVVAAGIGGYALRKATQRQELYASLEGVKSSEAWSMAAVSSEADPLSRRAFGTAALGVASGLMLGDDAAHAYATVPEMDPIPSSRYKKLPSGVIYADAETGSGREVQEGDNVSVQWVLRRSNGYFVDSSDVSGGDPFQFQVGSGKAIQGLDEGVIGMQAGGVRRLLIPPSLAYVFGVEDGKPGPIPAGFGPRQQVRRIQEVRKDVPGEYIFLEVELSRIR